MRKLLVVLLLILALPCVLAKENLEEGHINLLAVAETDDGYVGSKVDLYLNIQPGFGRVFLDTYPLSKIDTQISTRFAKEVACDLLDVNCDNFDFFYTIRSDAVIIGGPSAGAAVTVLTMAMLDNLNISEGVAITGTINSGGIVGPVGSVKEKIDAARDANITKVLVSDIDLAKDNETVELIDYANSQNVTLIPVSDIYEALYEFTGMPFEEKSAEFEVDTDYENMMRSLAVQLCNRSSLMMSRVEYAWAEDVPGNQTLYSSLFNDGLDLFSKSRTAFDNKRYYSAASYCYGANLKFHTLYVYLAKLQQGELKEQIELLESDLNNFENKTDLYEKTTISDLETYMVVKERLVEAREYIEEAKTNLEEDNQELASYYIVLTTERVYSARIWAKFFEIKKNVFSLDKETLKKSCMNKISEAQERKEYVKIFFPGTLEETEELINDASQDLVLGNYELCLFKASKAKAQAGVILSTFGVEDIKNLLDKKLKAAKAVIAIESNKGFFPIIGYSYYEYAQDLKDDEEYTALLFSEYAMEFSGLDLYLKTGKEETETKNTYKVDSSIVFIFILGFIIGILFYSLLIKKENKNNEVKATIVRINKINKIKKTNKIGKARKRSVKKLKKRKKKKRV